VTRHRIRKYLPILIIVGALVVAGGLFATRQKPARTPNRVVAPLVETITARSTTETIVVAALGTVMPSRTVAIQPELSGRLVAVHPDLVLGGLLPAGAVAARIDPRDYAAALAQARARLAQARTALEVERGRQVVARREWKLFEGDLDATLADSMLALRKPQLDLAEADYASAQSVVEQAERNLARTSLTVPFNAVVRTAAAEVGQLVTGQSQLATLAGTDEYWVQVAVPLDRLDRIQIPDARGGAGAKARIRFQTSSGAAQEKSARVVRLLGDLDPEGRTARVLVAVADPLDLAVRSDSDRVPLLLGSYVSALIDAGSTSGLFRVPREAIREGDQVWVLAGNGTLAIRGVTISWREENHVLVSTGLADGDRIITSSLQAPIPGMALREKGAAR
jgi:RND family efflux transporter MFP subunit